MLTTRSWVRGVCPDDNMDVITIAQEDLYGPRVFPVRNYRGAGANVLVGYVNDESLKIAHTASAHCQGERDGPECTEGYCRSYVSVIPAHVALWLAEFDAVDDRTYRKAGIFFRAFTQQYPNTDADLTNQSLQVYSENDEPLLPPPRIYNCTEPLLLMNEGISPVNQARSVVLWSLFDICDQCKQLLDICAAQVNVCTSMSVESSKLMLQVREAHHVKKTDMMGCRLE